MTARLDSVRHQLAAFEAVVQSWRAYARLLEDDARGGDGDSEALVERARVYRACAEAADVSLDRTLTALRLVEAKLLPHDFHDATPAADEERVRERRETAVFASVRPEEFVDVTHVADRYLHTTPPRDDER